VNDGDVRRGEVVAALTRHPIGHARRPT
jgi:hypothetical protein